MLAAILFMLDSITSTVHAKTNSHAPLLNVAAGGSESQAEQVTDEVESRTELQAASPNEPSEQPEDNRPWQAVRMRVTAYCPCEKCCGKFADGITACGHKIQSGDTFVAADKRYAFDTEMIIEGYNNSQMVKVLDRGGAIKGNKLDVFFKTHQEALEWGVRYIDVKVRCK